jgi:predicted SnoaL-like aldol condensation-catalyzing enzyme
MTKTVEEANKALVLEAFDTLFNKRDYKAAERFWSPNYIQHSAQSIWTILWRSAC